MKKVLLASAIAAASLATGSYADGIVEGRISDADGGLSYAGAVVRIEELKREVLVGNNGRFRLPAVAAGSYTLTISFSDQSVEERTIEIKDDEVTTVDLALNPSQESIEEILVVGQAAQIQRALDRQRYADNMISAINADAIGQLPDNNAADALQRVPGLSVERDQGEGRFVRVRGISPDLNAVTINGTQLPAPEGGRRAVALDVMPADLINSLVVTKALTPDMDANSIGGSIEVESLSALDRDGAFYTARIEAAYDEHSEQTSPAYGLTGGNTFEFSSGQRLGVAGAVSWEQRKFGSENVETGGKWKFEEGEAAALEEVQLRDYSIERERIGAALNFDFEMDVNNSLYLRTLYSEYKDDEQRQKTEVVFGELEEGEFADKERIAGETGIAEVKRELKDREETQKIFSATFGGEHYVDDWTIEYAVGFSKAEEDEPGGIKAAEFELNDEVVGAEYLSGVGFSNTRKPKLVAGSDLYDAASYKLDKVELEKAYVEDRQNSVKFDLSREFEVADYLAMVKFGAKTTQRKKTEDEDVAEYEDFAEGGLSAYSSGNVDYSLGNFGPVISGAAIRSALSTAELQDDKEGGSVVADNEIEENINAAYVMGRIDIDELRILAGVRHEQTQTKLQGSKVNFYEDEVTEEDVLNITEVDTDNNYSHTLPALHLRYELADNAQLRAAWTNSIVRPTFGQMSPSFSQEGAGTDSEAEKGNPDLKAMESANFDFGVEYFTGTAGVISAFAFQKNIEHFIFQTDLAGTAGFENFSKVETYRNGDAAVIKGLELAYSQKLNMLPAPFDDLLLSTNATFSESDAEVVTYDEGEKLSRDISMPNQSDITGNVVLGYEKGDLMLRLAANYKSEYLLEVQDVKEASEDIYQGEQTQLDFSAAYNITEQLKLNFEVANLTDEPYYAYQNKEQYNAQYEDYGPTYRLGITYANF